MAHVPGYVIRLKNGRILQKTIASVDAAKLREIAKALGVTDAELAAVGGDIEKIVAGDLMLS
jgi:hypothetical protein